MLTNSTLGYASSSSSGARARERFFTAMRSIDIGARLVRRRFEWTITKQAWRDTSIDLTLRHGRRLIVVSVGVCHYGPLLSDAGLRSVASAPAKCKVAEGTA